MAVRTRQGSAPTSGADGSADRARYSNPDARKLSSLFLPMIRWSWTTRPIVSAAAAMRRVISMSGSLGVGSPEGWLWNSPLI